MIPLLALLMAQRNDEATIFIALVFAPAMALACGIILGLRIGQSVSGKIGLALLISLFLCFGSELTLAAGCAWLRR